MTLARPPADERAVSTAIGYALAISITTVLVAGVLTAGATLVDGERDRIAAIELETAGEQLARGISDVDRLRRAADDNAAARGGDVTTAAVRLSLPRRVAGRSYAVSIDADARDDPPYTHTITLRTDATTRTVSVRTATPIVAGRVDGGPVRIEYVAGADAAVGEDAALVVREDRR
ncbi:DUF7266 family protein [Haloferacaceae archaeon DSL9]